MKKPKFGLKELPKDERDYKLGQILVLPKLEELPKEFLLENDDIKEQIDDFCSGFTTALLIGINEGIKISGRWMMAVSKMISGDPEEWGQDMREAMKVGVKYGALPQELSPYEKSTDSVLIRKIENWSQDLFWPAKKQMQKTYFSITGPYDDFDNIRASIYALKKMKQKQGVALGVMWSWGLSQYLLNSIGSGTGHMLSCIGWTEKDEKPYLVLQNSYGKVAGKNGRHLVSRNVVNTFVKQFGAMMYIDLPKDEVGFMIEKKLTLKSRWWVRTYFLLRDFVGL